jgi:hypothetical protein
LHDVSPCNYDRDREFHRNRSSDNNPFSGQEDKDYLDGGMVALSMSNQLPVWRAVGTVHIGPSRAIMGFAVGTSTTW